MRPVPLVVVGDRLSVHEVVERDRRLRVELLVGRVDAGVHHADLDPAAVHAVVGARLLGAEVAVRGLHRDRDPEVGLEADQAGPAGERLGAGGRDGGGEAVDEAEPRAEGGGRERGACGGGAARAAEGGDDVEPVARARALQGAAQTVVDAVAVAVDEPAGGTVGRGGRLGGCGGHGRGHGGDDHDRDRGHHDTQGDPSSPHDRPSVPAPPRRDNPASVGSSYPLVPRGRPDRRAARPTGSPRPSRGRTDGPARCRPRARSCRRGARDSGGRAGRRTRSPPPRGLRPSRARRR